MLYLNSIHNEFFDGLMPVLTTPWIWVPIYLIVLFYVHKIYGVKGLAFFLISVGLTVTLCDRISVVAFKDVFERWRPCHNGEIGDLIHTVKGKCGGRFGFVSSHATNFFGLAMIFIMALRKNYKWVTIPLLLWASIVGYTRIYLGVHYPADVACGALLGMFLGAIAYGVFRLLIARYTDYVSLDRTS